MLVPVVHLTRDGPAGKIVSRRPEVIRQALKYDWAEGPSVRRPVTSKQSKLKAAPTPTPTPAKSMADVAGVSIISLAG